MPSTVLEQMHALHAVGLNPVTFANATAALAGSLAFDCARALFHTLLFVKLATG
jgi:hypothetical protein